MTDNKDKNPFTSHGYVPGLPAKPSPAGRKHYKRKGFGDSNGTIPGMGPDHPARNFTIKRKA